MLRINNVLDFKLMLHKHNECLLALHMTQRGAKGQAASGLSRLSVGLGVIVTVTVEVAPVLAQQAQPAQ